MSEITNVLKKGKSNFYLMGNAVVNDYTFQIDEKGKSNSNYLYNRMSLNVDCGEKNGSINCEMFGGYDSLKPRDLFVHGKNDDGSDNFQDTFYIDWNNRNDPSTIKDLGDNCFIEVALEKDVNDKLIHKKFLSEYDAVEYISEHLKNGQKVYVTGQLRYSLYNDKVQVNKSIRKIVAIQENENNKDNRRADFRQTVLLTKDSANASNINRDKGILYIDGYVVDYVSGYKDTDYKGNVPIPVTYEFLLDMSDMKKTKKQIDVLFKVKKKVTEITFEGSLVEGGKVSEIKYDDLDEDIKELVDIGVLTEEEACAKYTDGSKEKRMIITKPATKKIEVDGVSRVAVDKTEEKYSEDDLVVDLSEYLNNEEITDEDLDSLDADIDKALNEENPLMQDNDEIDLADLFN